MAFIIVLAAFLLMLDGEWARAAILLVSIIALAAADGLFYPQLVGDLMKLHTAVAFVAVVGGFLVFGPVGFVLGALTIAVTLALPGYTPGAPGHTCGAELLNLTKISLSH